MDVYEIVNERILKLLETGTNPWHKPWQSAATSAPRNAITGRQYNGINVLMLGFSPYEHPLWATFNQIKAAGGAVKKGAKSTPAVFWKITQHKDESTGEIDAVPMLRYYNVFNVDQTEGLEIERPTVPAGYQHDPIASCEAIVNGMPNRPSIATGGGIACYSPTFDAINMPARSAFPKVEEYYSTLMHELVHSTGHASRLARKDAFGGGFGSDKYGREELVAEMGAAYLCAAGGIVDATVDNSAAYLAGWAKKIREDKRAVVVAAGAAQKAVDFILGRGKVEATVES